MSGSGLGIDLIQLNAEGMNAVLDDDDLTPSDDSPAADDSTAL
jgi:hypothetical protein